MVVGASRTYFREALLHSIKSLGLSTEEMVSQLKIKETGEELHVSTQGGMGIAQLRLAGKPSPNSTTVIDIKNAMVTYFQTNPGSMNYITPCLYLVLGLFLLATVVSLGGANSFI